MKFRGRIGPAALIGVGTQIRVHDDGTVVAATCSGKICCPIVDCFTDLS